MAKAKTSPLMWIVAVAVVALIVGLFAYGIPQRAVDQTQTLTSTGDCKTTPSISLSLVNAINKGTTVSGETTYAIVNGDYIGSVNLSSKNFAFGDDVTLLVSISNYIDKVVDVGALKCGPNSVVIDMYATDDGSFSIYNDDGSKVTDAIGGGATNQSSSANTITMEVRVEGSTDESTGDLIIVVEATNTSQVDDLVINGATKVDTPEFYSVAGSGSITKAYEIPALVDGATKTYTLSVSPESGETIDGTGVYVTAYSKQAFVDTDGSFDNGVEDSDGTNKYEDDWDYDFLIT